MTDPNTAPANPVHRLEAGVAELRVPEPMAAAESMLLKVGFILPILGVGMMMLAWWTASGSAFVADQIPMLISGGLVGLAVVMVGLGLFLRYSLTRLFRFWLARMLVEHQVQTDRLVEALDNIETAVRQSRLPQ